jgi:ligand-binding sensor domain-containing protein
MHVQVDTRDNATLYTGSQFGYYGRRGPAGHGDVRPQAGLKETPLRYNWNTPILLSSHNQDIVYYGTNKLFRSMDKGVTWTAISPDLTTSKERGDVPYATITSISESPKRFGLLWVGTDDGHVDVSDDGGVHWNSVDKSLPKQWVSRVVASSHDEHRAYITLNGYRNDDMTPWVYRSDDMGKSWTSISAGLPSESVNVIREDPVNADVLYIGTDRGVYVSLDRGAHWDSLQANLPNVPVHDLAVHPRERELIAGTHGRSVWIVDVLPVQELSKVRNETVHLFPVEKTQFDRDWKSAPSLWFDESQDLPRLKLPFWAKAAGTAQFAVLDKNGNTVREVSIPTKAGINTYTWDLLVDRDLALAAEKTALAKDASKTDSLDKTPIAEAVRLQQRLYAPPGTYTLRLSLDGAKSETKWELKAPEAQPPRAPPKPKLRGKDDWPRPQPEAEPLPGAEEAGER